MTHIFKILNCGRSLFKLMKIYTDQIRNTRMWNNQLSKLIKQLTIPHSSISYRRRGSTTPTTSKMKLFMTIINSLQPLIIVIKSSILDIAEVLDQPLACQHKWMTHRYGSRTSKSSKMELFAVRFQPLTISTSTDAAGVYDLPLPQLKQIQIQYFQGRFFRWSANKIGAIIL